MSRPPIVAKEIQIYHNGIIFTIQVPLVEEGILEYLYHHHNLLIL